jgi:hypothetical protein
VDDGQLVAWVTVEKMPDACRAWLALSAAHSATGLVPVLVQEDRPDRRPDGWEPYSAFFSLRQRFPGLASAEKTHLPGSRGLVDTPTWTFWWD